MVSREPNADASGNAEPYADGEPVDPSGELGHGASIQELSTGDYQDADVHQFEEIEGPLHSPEAEQELRTLINRVTAALVQLIVDPLARDKATHTALDWLALHLNALKVLLGSGSWTLVDGHVRLYRGSVYYQPPMPSRDDMRMNRIIFGELAAWILQNLTTHPSLLQRLGPVPQGVVEVLADAHLIYLESLFTSPKLSNPFLPWEAFLTARKNKRRIPTWVLEFIEQKAEVLVKLPGAHLSRVDKAVSSALGLANEDGRKGPNAAIIARRNVTKQIKIFAFLHSNMTGTRPAPDQYEKAIKHFGTDQKTLAAIYTRIATVLGQKADS